MAGVAALAALLVAASATATPQPRLAPGNNRVICLDHEGVSDGVRDAVAGFLRRQLIAATRGEAVVVGSDACDAAGGDVVVRLSHIRSGLALIATDG